MEARRDVDIDRLTSDFNEIETNVLDDTENCTILVSIKNTALPTYLNNSPKVWSVPSATVGWTPATRKEVKGEPKFEDVDNPGQWSEFTFQPNFEGEYGSGAYGHHATPAGAKVVPLDPMTGKRTVNKFYFFCDGWKLEETNPNYSRQHSNTDNFFPVTRSSQLDGSLLKKIGLTDERMKSEDALFFAQLVIPICNPAKSGIKGDPRNT